MFPHSAHAFVTSSPPPFSSGDLNALLAQEQTAIMRAEAAISAVGHEGHRLEALRLRHLVNLTPYPDRAAHDFTQGRAFARSKGDGDLETLRQRVEQNELLLAVQFSQGDVHGKAFQHRSRVLRQERAQISNARNVISGDKVS